MRVGICLPTTVSWTLKGSNGGQYMKSTDSWNEVSTVGELDASSTGNGYVYDTEIGYVGVAVLTIKNESSQREPGALLGEVNRKCLRMLGTNPSIYKSQ